MKIKNKLNTVIKLFKDISDISEPLFPTFMSVDIKGNMIIDGAVKLVDYTDNHIEILSKIKIMSIFGDKLKISSFDNHTIVISGKISKIEFLEV